MNSADLCGRETDFVFNCVGPMNWTPLRPASALIRKRIFEIGCRQIARLAIRPIGGEDSSDYVANSAQTSLDQVERLRANIWSVAMPL